MDCNKTTPIDKIIYGYHSKRLYALMQDGRKRSAADISIALRLSDPRSIIRDLRHKGVRILDQWRKAEHGTRYKVYYLNNDTGNE